MRSYVMLSSTAVLVLAAVCLQPGCDGSLHGSAALQRRAAWSACRASSWHIPHIGWQKGWSLEPQRWQPTGMRLHLRGGGDEDVRMDVDSGPDAAAADATQGESGGALEADSGAAPASGAVNITVKWKLSSFALEIDTWQSAEVLKFQLYSITQVAPEEQFLIGVYQPGQDANLSGLDLKESQTLILLGDPSRAPPPKDPAPALGPTEGGAGVAVSSRGDTVGCESQMELDGGDVVATSAGGGDAADDIIAQPPHQYDDMPKRGSFSMTSRIANNELDYLHRLQDNVTGLEKLLPEVTELLNATLSAANLFSAPDAPAVAEVEQINEDHAPTTLPREFWNKKIVDYNDDERARLKQWLADTRQWRVATKKAVIEDEQAKALEQDKLDVIEHQALVDEHLAAGEKELNKYGLSLERSRQIILKGFDLFPLPFSDPTTNQTLLKIRADPELMKKELSGGLVYEDSKEWLEAVDWLDEWLEERMTMTGVEAVRRYDEYLIKSAALDAQIEQESEASLLEYEDESSNINPQDEDGELLLEEAALTEGRPARRRKLSDVVAWGWERSDNLPLGLDNLGNTCYMAAALQVLRAVPELMRGVLTFTPSGHGFSNLQENLVQAIRLLCFELTDRKDSVKPYTAIHHLRQLVPQFAESGPMGPMQQDSEECLAAILQALDAILPREESPGTPSSRGGGGVFGGRVRQLFEIEMQTTTRCTEAESEDAEVIQKERMLRLALNIDSKTNVIHDAIKSSLAYDISKNSPSLKRDATFNVTAEISRLPPYLAVQFVRFYWRTDTKKKAKICRNVYFPTVLDMLPYCTEGVRIPIEKELANRRAAYMKSNSVWDDVDQNDELAVKWAQMDREEAEEAELARNKRLQEALEKGADGVLTEEMRVEIEEAKEMMEQERLAVELERNSTANGTSSTRDAPSTSSDRLLGASSIKHSALYNLRAIITHQGRYADAGHYIAWVKTGIRERTSAKGAPQPMWLKFDDEKVSLHTEEEVKLTAGGADGPIAYVCLYGRSSAVAEGITESHQSMRGGDVY